jgi:hypothetical protein
VDRSNVIVVPHDVNEPIVEGNGEDERAPGREVTPGRLTLVILLHLELLTTRGTTCVNSGKPLSKTVLYNYLQLMCVIGESTGSWTCEIIIP